MNNFRATPSTRVVGGVLALAGFANGFAAIALPPKAPVSGPARAVLVAISMAVAVLGLVLAGGRRWIVWPLIAAVAASMIVTWGVLTSGEAVRLGNIFTGSSQGLLVTYPMGLLSVLTVYGFGLVILLAEVAWSRRGGMPSEAQKERPAPGAREA